MSNEAPTDALRLVPVETLRRCAAVLLDPRAEHAHEGGGQCSGITGELKSPDLDALENLADEATIRTDGGEWKSDDYGIRRIWAKSLKGGNAHIADVRGWGYFTGMGHGALGLTDEEGIEAQRQIGQFIAAANPATIKALIAEVRSLQARVARWEPPMMTATASSSCSAFLARNGKGEG